jgi:hypothetical protein
LSVGATIEIRENGSRITAISPHFWEVPGERGKPLLHLWAENCNVTRACWPSPTSLTDAWPWQSSGLRTSNPSAWRLSALSLCAAPNNFSARISASNSCETLEKVDPCASGATPDRSRRRSPRTGSRACAARNHCARLGAGPRGCSAFSWAAFCALERCARLF